MYLIKIFQSIICHQLTRFFSNKNSINHKNPSSCDKTNKTPSTLFLPWRHSKPRFLLIRPPPKRFRFHQGATSPMRSWSCGFKRWKGSAWVRLGILLDDFTNLENPWNFRVFFPFQKATCTFWGAEGRLFVGPDCIFCLRQSKPQQGTESMLDRILEVWLQRREWRNLWRLTFSTKFIHVIWSWLHDQAHMTHG